MNGRPMNHPMTNRRRRAGYILVETAVALVLLSVGSFAVHRTIQEAIRTRGQAQDFTRARFLLNGTLGELLAQPLLTEKATSGRYTGSDSRFAWSAEVKRVDVPIPTAPLRPRRGGGASGKFEFPQGMDYLARVSVTVTWQRNGIDFAESCETLLGPNRLWQPPRAPRRP